APVMTAEESRALQTDFVVLVHAVGELDTTFREVPRVEAAAPAIDDLVSSWPQVSSDLAELVGTLTDNLDNFTDLEDLDGLPGGLGGLPWLLVGLGVLSAGLAVAAWPHRTKETP